MKSLAVKCTKLVGVAALLFWLAPGISQAATCTVGTTGGSVTDATDCGMGVAGDENPNSGELFTVTGIADLEQIDKNDPPADSTPELFTTAGTSGSWKIDTLGETYEDLVLVMKDGQPSVGTYKWLWFVIDQSAGANTCSLADAAAGWDLCGLWTMYEGKNVSHFELWGVEGDDTTETPEPGSLLLLGLGLAGLALVRRRRV